MSLNGRLDAVLKHQLGLARELHASQRELALVHSRVQMRMADLEQQAVEAEEQYRQAVAEGDPQAETLRDWPERIRARIEELKAGAAGLEATEADIRTRIRAAEQDIEDFRALQPQIVARVAMARGAGLGREVFETLTDALNYLDIALAAAQSEDQNGPLRAEKKPEREQKQEPEQL
jgi:chromosome segregation ATPase